MFSIILSILIADATSMQCPTPEIRDWTKPQFRYSPDPVEDFYPAGSVLNFYCQHGTVALNSAEKMYSRKCQQNGTWTAEPLICGLDLDENVRVSTHSGFCSLKKMTCKTSTAWKIELVDAVETEGVKITVEETEPKLRLEITDLSGYSESCSFRKLKTNTYFSYCRVATAKAIKISSQSAVNIKDINIISSNTGREGKECPYPGSPSGGKIAENLENSQVTYRCIDGYQLEGSASRRCNLETGKYDQNTPSCAREL